MEQSHISAFDMFKVGVGPSSSHTLGPWRAALDVQTRVSLPSIDAIEVHLYGSLAKTGKGHGTVLALMLGLSGYQPDSIALTDIRSVPAKIKEQRFLLLGGKQELPFEVTRNIQLHTDKILPRHANGMTFVLHTALGPRSFTYYSIGGGFIRREEEFDTPSSTESSVVVPHHYTTGAQLLQRAAATEKPLYQMALENEMAHGLSEREVKVKLKRIWLVMRHSIYTGCNNEGVLPGGLSVVRRAKKMHHELMQGVSTGDIEGWFDALRAMRPEFEQMVKFVSCFALAVSEENAAFGRIVTAPTNGAAGVIPAVLLYHLAFSRTATEDDVWRFLLVAAEIGALFKRGATISAAMGGCQAEIGVSSAMAAAALTHVTGGTVAQALMAAEIAMEHHLGLTCDPVGGLVQIPCIERNTMGAIKAITATQLARGADPTQAKISLDAVIQTMKATAADMSHKYKETAEGGLAKAVPVGLVEC